MQQTFISSMKSIFSNHQKTSHIPYLFYTNKHCKKHNEDVFNQTFGQTFTFQATNILHSSCPPSFKLPNNFNKIVGLHKIIRVKKICL